MAIDTPDDKHPSSIEGRLGYIAGKVGGISDDVRDIKKDVKLLHQTTVTKDECTKKHDECKDRFEHHIREDASQPAVQALPSVPFDFWSWAGKRLPVVLGLLALLCAVGAAYHFYMNSKENHTAVRNMIKNNPPQKVVYKPVIVPQFLLTPNGGVEPEKKRRRK